MESKTDFKFAYSDKSVDLKQQVTVRESNNSLYEILDAVSRQTDLNFVQVNEQILVTAGKKDDKSAEVFQQVDALITGIVKDESGEPLPGATVAVQGSSKGTVTDIDGKFQLEVSDGATIVVSFIGFEPQQVTVGSLSVLEIILKQDASSLSEVIVVGYGSQKRENLTGAVSTVNFDDELQNRPLTNASQALSGQVPGVWVSQNSGQPGNDGAQIRVRGWGTLNNSNPLILVDGVEASINEINPNDIESMTVLKDAASSAIYGSRAANGVVLITLKSGKFGEKTRVNIGSYVGQQSLGKRYEIIDNSAEYMGLWNDALMNQGGSALFPESVINEFRNNNDPYRYPNTNFFDEVFKTAPITEHNLSINGGSEQTKFYISMNYLDQEGIMQNSESSRYGLTVNLESKLNDWLTIGGRMNGIKKATEEPYNLGRMMYIFANGAYPFTAPYTEDGRFGSVQALNSNGNTIVGNRNPLIETANGLTLTENNFFKMNVFANIKFTDYLTLTTNITTQYNSNLRDRHNSLEFGYTNTGLEGRNLDYLTILEASRTNVQNSYNILFSTLNFNKTFNEIHSLSAIVGTKVESTVIKDVFGRRSDPPKEGLTQINAGTSGFQANGNLSELRMLSYFGRVNYALSDKYLFEMNLRADGSSRFKEGYRWGVFPAFSAGWRLGEEAFIQNSNVFSDLKLRASWGKLGNQNIDSYWPYLAAVNQTNALSYNFGGTFAPGAGVTALVDETIGWETSMTTDIGLEFGLLDNRLFVEADYFRKTTNNIIVQLPIPAILGGVNAPFENVGAMINNGFEFNINYSKIAPSRDKIGYNVGVNMTYIVNQVTKFRKNAPDQLYLIREGYSFRELYGYNAVGIYQSNLEASEHMFANGYVPKAGELKYEDVNNDGRLGFEDKMALGNTIPKYTFGFTPSVTYKGFDLSTLVMGIAGASVYTQNAWTQPLGISGGTITKRWRDAWTPENMDTNVPRISISDTWRSEPSSFWVNDVSFVKLRNIQLGYTFDPVIAKRLGLQKLYLYANAQNVAALVSQEYEGFDPERNTFDSGENFYPLPKIFTLGININL